jgi:hypothetical protein
VKFDRVTAFSTERVSSSKKIDKKKSIVKIDTAKLGYSFLYRMGNLLKNNKNSAVKYVMVTAFGAD